MLNVLREQDWQTMAHRSYPVCHLYRMIFTILNEFLEKKKKTTFHDKWKWHEVQISVSTNEVSLEHSPILSFIDCLWLLCCCSGRVQCRGQPPHGLQTPQWYLLTDPSQIKSASLLAREGKEWPHRQALFTPWGWSLFVRRFQVIDLWLQGTFDYMMEIKWERPHLSVME